MAIIQHHEHRVHAQATAHTDDTDAATLTRGSLWHHVSVMSLTGSVGLIALFAVDLIDLYFLSLLGEGTLAAAVGYAGTLLFFSASVAIGVSIAMGALTGKAIGAGDTHHAREYMWHILAFAVMVTAPLALLMWIYAPQLLALIGAEGETLDYATTYMRYLVPSLPILALAMSANALLRAVGDAKRAMYATLYGGVANALLDPLFIFVLDLHIAGAALASVGARLTIFLVSLYPLLKYYDFGGACVFTWAGFRRDVSAIRHIAIPAILTNLATPIGNAYVIMVMAQFGDAAVAGFSVVGRVSVVAFAVLFALSGAVGPIIAQNYGAGLRARIVETLRDAAWFSVLYVGLVSCVLFFLDGVIITIFDLDGAGAEIVSVFMQILSWTYIFSGFAFVANAAFNNLDRVNSALVFNFARATVFTIPFVWLGAQWWGAPGVLIGQAIGGSIVGVISLWYAFVMVERDATRRTAEHSAAS